MQLVNPTPRSPYPTTTIIFVLFETIEIILFGIVFGVFVNIVYECDLCKCEFENENGDCEFDFKKNFGDLFDEPSCLPTAALQPISTPGAGLRNNHILKGAFGIDSDGNNYGMIIFFF